MKKVDSKYLKFWRSRFEKQKAASLALADSARADLAKSVEILRNYGAKRILLYGSLCRSGRFHRNSDIDLVAEGIPPQHFTRAASDLMMAMDWPVDLKPLEDLDGLFRDLVIKKGELIYAEKGNKGSKSFIISERGVDSLADSSPLQRLIEKYVTEKVIRSVALAHQTGRRLYIGTTDLDAGRLVIWNMGIVAASNRPETDDLFRKILLASASIPILLPPVYIPVEVGDEIYDEMHVDGGVATQVFLYGDILNLDDVARSVGLSSVGAGQIYIIQNLKSIPRYEPVKSNLVAISKKTVTGLLTNQGNGDLYRIYAIAQRAGIKFKLVFIPSDFELQDPVNFDPVLMKRLFDLGYRMALSGDPWQNHPPGYKD